MAANLVKAILWAIDIELDASHGYDQEHRYGPDYDCSSLVAAALIQGGFSGISPGMYTGNEYSQLTAAGFVPVTPIGQDIRAGDVFFYHQSGNIGHTCMAINSYQIVEASGKEHGGATGGTTGDQTGQEIRVINYQGGNWDYQMRYVERGYYIAGPGVMTQAMMENNADIICNYLVREGWTPNAIAAFLGNAQVDSDINPGHWENYDSSDPSNGFGIVQWKPSTDYTTWAAMHGYAPDNGTGQLLWIATESVNSGYWQPTVEYPVTFLAFILSEYSPADLASVWAYNFARCDPGQVSSRSGAANAWYQWMGGKVLPTDFPKWLLFKFVERRRRQDGRSV